MTKKLLSLILCAVMILTVIPIESSAGGADLGLRPLEEGEAYQPMLTSQDMVDMIKNMEGFRPEPYWDVSQWTIGYGTSCGTDQNSKPDITMTEEEAEAELLKRLEEQYGKAVNEYCEKIGKQPSQNQFDGLVDFTYNLGTGWMDGCRLTKWLEQPTSEMDLVTAMGLWCRVGSEVSYHHAARRVRDALVFLHGEYYLMKEATDFESDVPVVSNHDLPRYKFVWFRANGGKIGSKPDSIAFCRVNSELGEFPTPEWEAHDLTGWKVIAESNINLDAPYDVAPGAAIGEKNLEIVAQWVEVEPEPTEPETSEPKPEKPESTDPKPTEPETTDPKPTEPETAEPETTEPETTESEATEPAATEPEVTEPEPTEPAEPEETEPEEPDKESGLPFYDVDEDDWYFDPVFYVYEHKLMSGTTENRFSPNRAMTRAMLVTVLYRIDGSPAVSDDDRDCFVDTQNAYYTDAVAWAKANGIVSGISETRFGPENRVTRQDAVTMFYQYCVGYLGLDGTPMGDLSDFVDDYKVEDYAREPMEWAVGADLIAGTTAKGGRAINPRGNITRAEGATVFTAMIHELLTEN